MTYTSDDFDNIVINRNKYRSQLITASLRGVAIGASFTALIMYFF